MLMFNTVLKFTYMYYDIGDFLILTPLDSRKKLTCDTSTIWGGMLALILASLPQRLVS